MITLIHDRDGRNHQRWSSLWQSIRLSWLLLFLLLLLLLGRLGLSLCLLVLLDQLVHLKKMLKNPKNIFNNLREMQNQATPRILCCFHLICWQDFYLGFPILPEKGLVKCWFMTFDVFFIIPFSKGNISNQNLIKPGECGKFNLLRGELGHVEGLAENLDAEIESPLETGLILLR